MSKFVNASYFCDFCGNICKTRRAHIPPNKDVPVHLCLVTNDCQRLNVNYMLDICENCAKKLARVPLQAKSKEAVE